MEPEERQLPVRTYAFDPNAARKAWRQVARTRGARGMRLDGRDTGSRLAPLALGLVAVVAALLWWTGGTDPEPVESAAAVARAPATADEPSQAPRAPGMPWQVDDDPVDGLDLAPQAAVPPASTPTALPAARDELAPAPVAPVVRALPPGTSIDNARALRKLPHSVHDGTPVGGIGREGLHVDRIGMGTVYEDRACTGPVGKFSIGADKRAHLCFRTVHRRVKQTVIVRWERNGTLMRRTFVSIGDSHAYRTRATLPLRRKYAGDWTVRVMSTDGVELARQSFQVLR